MIVQAVNLQRFLVSDESEKEVVRVMYFAHMEDGERFRDAVHATTDELVRVFGKVMTMDFELSKHDLVVCRAWGVEKEETEDA